MFIESHIRCQIDIVNMLLLTENQFEALLNSQLTTPSIKAKQ